MPSEGRRLHAFTVVSSGLRLAKQLLFPAIIGGASAGGGIGGTLQWILLILSVPSLAIAVAQWLAFRFRIEGEDLIIHSGVLARRRRVIPIARVQNIDLEQSFLERLAGVAQLRLETASGGSDTEADLAVLGLDEAHALQAEMLRLRHHVDVPAGAADDATGAPQPGEPRALEGPGVESAAPETPRVLLRLGVSDLAIAGATSNEAGLIAAGLATLLELSGDFIPWDRVGSIFEPVLGQGAEVGVASAVIAGVLVVAAFFVLGWMVSIGATIVRFYGFTVTRAGDDLRREYGLLSRHRSTVPLERIQAVRIEETLLRRPLGLAALKIETAGAAPGRKNQEGGRAEAFVPLARRRDVGRLLAAVFDDARFDGVAFSPVSPLSRKRAFRRLAALVVIATTVAVLFLDPAQIDLGGLAALLLLVPAWFYARAQYRARGWARESGYALARGGVITRVTWVVPERKIQTLHLRETPFQRRHDLGTVMIDTAAGGRVARIVDVTRDTGVGLLASLSRGGPAARRLSAAARPGLDPTLS